MTPKEKAQELFDKYMKPIDGLHKYPMCFDTSKQCALIAVDEILKITWVDKFLTVEDYWNEVKHELAKL
jgi:hypothetical protein